MNKFFKNFISLGLLVAFAAGCATNPNYQPQNQTYGRYPTTTYHPNANDPKGEIFTEMTKHSRRTPQQDSFNVRWYVLSDQRKGTLFRMCDEIEIQPGGSLTAGVYPCDGIKTKGGSRYGDRQVIFKDPVLGTQTVNLSQMNGGYIQSEMCDRGYHPQSGKNTFEVQWSTHDPIRGPKGGWGRFVRNVFDTCEPAPREITRLAELQFRAQQQLEQQRLRSRINLERRKLKIQTDEELRRYEESLGQR